MSYQTKENSFIRVSGYKCPSVEVRSLITEDKEIEERVINSGIFEPIILGTSYRYQHQKIEIIFRGNIFLSINNYDLRHTDDITFRDIYIHSKKFLWELYHNYQPNLEGEIFKLEGQVLDKGIIVSDSSTGRIGIKRTFRKDNFWEHGTQRKFDIYFKKNFDEYDGDMIYQGTFQDLDYLKNFLIFNERYKRYVITSQKPLIVKDFYCKYGRYWNSTLYEELIKYILDELR